MQHIPGASQHPRISESTHRLFELNPTLRFLALCNSERFDVICVH